MTDPDQSLLAAVINRLGRSELVDVLQNIFERLEALEPKPEAESPQEGETGSEGVESSSNPPEEPVSQEQKQGY